MTQKNKTILFVAKDITPAKYLVDCLPYLGNVDILVMLEDRGAAPKAFAGLSFGNVTFIKPYQAVDFDLLLVGCSTNSELESHMLDVALSSGKTTAAIVDFMGAQGRLSSMPNFYIAPNNWVTMELPRRNTHVVGDVNAVTMPTIDDESRTIIEVWQNGQEVVFWMAQSDSESLKIILERLQPHQKLLCGLHPDPGKWPDQTYIRRVRKELGAERMQVVSSLAPGLDSTGALSALAKDLTVVVNGYSGGGTTAAWNGYYVATADGPEIRECYAKSNPLARSTDSFLLPHMLGSPVVKPGQDTWDLFHLNYPHPDLIKRKLWPLDGDEMSELLIALCN